MCRQKTEECFICCSPDGKSEQEKLFEIQFGAVSINYPLLSLAKAYSCRCSTLYAHNKCLLKITKCPSCRKNTPPNLYIETKYDYYLARLFVYLKQDTRRIRQLQMLAGYGLIVIFLFMAILAYNEKAINSIIPKKSNASLALGLLIVIPYFLILYTLTDLYDYFKKYWLYDRDTERCYVFF